MSVGADKIGPADDSWPESQACETVNPATLAPLCGQAEFDEEVDELVAEEAPRVFAVVQEYGTRADARIAAWGMAFEDIAEVVGVDRSMHLRLRSPERATRFFQRRPHISAHVVWAKPNAPARPESEGAA